MRTNECCSLEVVLRVREEATRVIMYVICTSTLQTACYFRAASAGADVCLGVDLRKPRVVLMPQSTHFVMKRAISSNYLQHILGSLFTRFAGGRAYYAGFCTGSHRTACPLLWIYYTTHTDVLDSCARGLNLSRQVLRRNSEELGAACRRAGKAGLQRLEVQHCILSVLMVFKCIWRGEVGCGFKPSGVENALCRWRSGALGVGSILAAIPRLGSCW